MIIGNGLIANCFREFYNPEDVVIFASGVSNSKISNITEFDREMDLLLGLKDKISIDCCLVYFSSCGVINESSIYYQHKLNMENLIKENFKKYLIFRIPQLIGLSNNANTLINYFINSINEDKELVLQKQATRYFVEIGDLVFIVKSILSANRYYNNIYNVAIPIKYNIVQIINSIEFVLIKKARFKFVEGGTNYSIDLTFISDFLQNINFIYDDKYLQSSLEKLKL